MGQTTILVHDLFKQYGKGQPFTLKGLNFHVQEGEIFGFLGPNGAGKTTTIRIMAGLGRPTKGSCRILGQETYGNTALYDNLGIVFEESNLYGRLSGRENLRFFARLHGIPPARGDELLEQYGLSPAADKPVNTYSKGMKRRVLICRALLHDPRILILDEPTGGLDPTSAGVIQAALQSYRERGKTIFLSTHDMSEADNLCHRVAFIHNGQILALDAPSALKRRYGRASLVIEVKPHARGPGQGVGLDKALPHAQFVWANDLLKIHLPLDSGQLETAVDLAKTWGEILSLHSQEATLGQIFRKLTGAGLHVD